MKAVILFIVAWLILIVTIVFSLPTDAAELDMRLHAKQTATAYGLPPGLLQAICEQETRWRNLSGRHGEIGVCQIKPDTVKMICPECVDTTGPVLKPGSRGAAVARVQAVLAKEGLYKLTPTGEYDFSTTLAVRKYQRVKNLEADGLVGPTTWAALFGPHDPYPGTSITAALWEPKQNIEWAARILAWLRDNVSPDPMVMAAAYNGGHGNPVVRYMVQVKKRRQVALR